MTLQILKLSKNTLFSNDPNDQYAVISKHVVQISMFVLLSYISKKKKWWICCKGKKRR